MIRQLLALIALITGLAAVAEPAQARFADMETVGQAVATGMACKQGIPAAHIPTGRALERLESPRVCALPRIVIIVPPVMMQVDRAHE
ncbi:MAG: hypothetical protein RLZZ08_1291 [Pseudomonadota bacterium]|jgi:hypothetical protein